MAVAAAGDFNGDGFGDFVIGAPFDSPDHGEYCLRLTPHPENEMFVDKCCHLSELGNDLVAEQLMKILVRN